MKVLGLFLSISFFVAVPAFAKSDASKISELLELAKSGQLSLREAEFTREKANLSLLGARSGFLPDLGLRSSYTYDWQNAATNSDSLGSEAAIVSNWAIYDNGSAYRKYRIRRLEVSKAELQELAVSNSVSFDIFERYLRHFLAQRQKEITVGRLGLLQGQYRQTQRQYRQGLKTRRDNQRLESETERARLTLLKHEDAVQDSFNELKRYIGAGAEGLSKISFPAATVSGLLGRLEAGHNWSEFRREKMLAVQITEIEKDIKRIQSLEATTPLWPTLGLSGQVGYGSSQFAGHGESWSDQAGFFGQGLINLNWNFWDWGSRRSVARSAQLDERLASLRRTQIELDVVAEFDRFRRENLRLKKVLDVVRRVYEIEQSTFRDIEVEYRDGA